MIFSLLSFTLLGLVPLAQWVFGVPSLDFDAMAAAAFARTGVPWTSNLVDVVRLALVEPGLWLLLLGSAVPTLAALTMLLVARDAGALTAWVRRLSPALLWRAASSGAVVPFAIVCAAIVLGLFATFEVREALGATYERTFEAASAAILPALLASMFLDQGAILEEGGWRGYAGPTLQRAGMRPLSAAILVGIAWGLWHLPRDVVTGVIDRLGGFDYALLYLPSFFSGTVAVSIIAAYCMNRLGGSLWPAIAVHGLTNDAVGMSGSAAIDVALTPFHQATKAAPLAVIAGIIVLSAGPMIGAPRGSAQRIERVTTGLGSRGKPLKNCKRRS
ncbi:MAG: CPBP family intramembrane metalloprotease [Rhodomicrobium sp.]|nr:CPBP family intramembrane metalloprotease [Rhodomicrobium sp.]